MNHAQRIREIATSLLESNTDPAAAKDAAELLKLAGEIDKLNPDVVSANTDAAARAHLVEMEAHRTEQRKALFTALVPTITTLVTVGTLVFGVYQFRQSEKDKAAELEETIWQQSYKQFSDFEKVSPAAVFLSMWGQSPKHHTSARSAVKGLLHRAEDPNVFRDLLDALYEPVDWDKLPELVDIDRRLLQSISPMVTGSDDRQNLARLNPAQQADYNRLNTQLGLITGKICRALQSSGTPPSGEVDLSGTRLIDCDLTGAHLPRVNLTRTQLVRVRLKGVALDAARFEGIYTGLTAWWEAQHISGELLSELKRNHPYKPDGWSEAPFVPEEYAIALARLESASSK